MGHRLSKIYTRTGDDGSTGLGTGQRIAKDAPRMQAIGDVDELNSLMGWLIAHLNDEPLIATLQHIQHRLFDLGGELSIPGHQLINPAHAEQLEQLIDVLNQSLPPLKNFILPGGNKRASVCHLARSVNRRAERSLVTLNHQEPINPSALLYINRLSDYLFVLARTLARQDGGQEVLWQQDK